MMRPTNSEQLDREKKEEGRAGGQVCVAVQSQGVTPRFSGSCCWRKVFVRFVDIAAFVTPVQP